MNFDGKVVLITGGSSGIGAACVKEFAARKAAVAIIDRQPLVENSLGRGNRAEYFGADVSRATEVQQVIRAIVSRFGGIDVVVNNAGIQRYGTVTTISEEEWDEVLNVNLKSAFLVSKYAIPEMLKRGGGAIVMTGSVQSVTAVRNSAHYVTSKHALLGLTRSIALDYGKQNIRD